MSMLIFPVLSGMTLDVVRSYEWHSTVQQSTSGKQTAIAEMAYPLVSFKLNFELLSDILATSDLKALVGLHNQLQGRADFFLFSDPDFNTVTAMPFGTGDGTTTAFLITALYQNSGGPGTAELIQAFNGAPNIYNNGTLVSAAAYSIANGVITFTSAPAAGHALTWSGSFYYQCRFDKDTFPFTKFMNKWWMLKGLAFTSVNL